MDFSSLTDEQKLKIYQRLCEKLGIPPLPPMPEVKITSPYAVILTKSALDAINEKEDAK